MKEVRVVLWLPLFSNDHDTQLSRGSFNSRMTKLLYHRNISFQFNAAKKVNVEDSNSPINIQRQQSSFQCMQGSCGANPKCCRATGSWYRLPPLCCESSLPWRESPRMQSLRTCLTHARDVNQHSHTATWTLQPDASAPSSLHPPLLPSRSRIGTIVVLMCWRWLVWVDQPINNPCPLGRRC